METPTPLSTALQRSSPDLLSETPATALSPLTVRLNAKDQEALKDLASWLTTHTGRRVTPSAALRFALREGLFALETIRMPHE